MKMTADSNNEDEWYWPMISMSKLSWSIYNSHTVHINLQQNVLKEDNYTALLALACRLDEMEETVTTMMELTYILFSFMDTKCI